jgi:hypothetical protein
MNGTHQVLAYADDVNLLDDDIRTVERNADVLINACKDIGLAVNTRKTNYMEIHGEWRRLHNEELHSLYH